MTSTVDTVVATGRSAGSPTPRWATAGGLVRAVRPGQWVKNVLVFAAPAAAGTLTSGPTLLHALVAFVAFTLAAAACYLVNDVYDVAADRLHPRKRSRPIAAGVVSGPVALAVAGLSGLLAVAVAALLGWAFLVVLLGYVGLTTAYSLRLKHVPILDIVVVATGFLLRAIAGGVATDVPLSDWFLLVALFGALFLVVGKRDSEQRSMGERRSTRAALAGYPPGYLGQLTTLAMGGTLLGYAAWAFQYLGVEVFHPALALSVLPFMVAVLRYGLIVARGAAEDPERVASHDRFLQLAGLVWLVLVGGGLYLG